MIIINSTFLDMEEEKVLEGLKEGEAVIIGDSSSLPKTDSDSMPAPPGGRR